MTDIERVRQMVRDGRITEAEGEKLIAVLETVREADAELLAADEEMTARSRVTGTPTAPADATAPLPAVDAPIPATPSAPEEPAPAAAPGVLAAPGVPAAPAAAPAPPSAAPTASAPQGTRWVSVQMLAGDLEVTVDEALAEPEVESDGPVDVSVERGENGFDVRWDQPSGSFLDKMISRLRSGNLNLRIPAGYGLDLAATAGDVELVNVPYLRGHLTAGDLDATGLRGIDFTSRAGDIDIEVELSSGEHRINVTAGSVELRVTPASSVTIKAAASIGDVANKLLDNRTVSGSLGESIEGSYGGGQARLDVAVTTGKIKLEPSGG